MTVRPARTRDDEAARMHCAAVHRYRRLLPTRGPGGAILGAHSAHRLRLDRLSRAGAGGARVPGGPGHWWPGSWDLAGVEPEPCQAREWLRDHLRRTGGGGGVLGALRLWPRSWARGAAACTSLGRQAGRARLTETPDRAGKGCDSNRIRFGIPTP